MVQITLMSGISYCIVYILVLNVFTCSGEDKTRAALARKTGLVNGLGTSVVESILVTSDAECAVLCLEIDCSGFSLRQESELTHCAFSTFPAELSGGAWESFQLSEYDPFVTFVHRFDGSVDFNRTWAEYKAGFGDQDGGEFWLGLDNLASLTGSWNYGLRVDMESWSGDELWARYSHFSVAPETDNYRLSVSGYDSSSTAGDSLTDPILLDRAVDGMEFSTLDNDHDNRLRNCAEDKGGGWWYNACHYADATNLYVTGGLNKVYGINWYTAYGSWHSFKTMTWSLVIQN